MKKNQLHKKLIKSLSTNTYLNWKYPHALSSIQLKLVVKLKNNQYQQFLIWYCLVPSQNQIDINDYHATINIEHCENLILQLSREVGSGGKYIGPYSDILSSFSRYFHVLSDILIKSRVISLKMSLPPPSPQSCVIDPYVQLLPNHCV